MTAQTGRETLQRRAALLARPLAERRSDAVRVFLLVATGAGGHFALEARAVRQVLRDEPLCRLCTGPGALLAVAVVGGETVPVADLESLLDGGEPRRDRPFLVVLEGGPGPVGLLVDEVQEVVTVHQDDLRAVSSAPDSASAPHRLITPEGAVVVDIETLLCDDRLAMASPVQPHRPPTSAAISEGAR